ncbi:MAG: cation transporter [Enterococcus sp.]
MKQVVQIVGMSCQHCVKKISVAIYSLPGVQKVKILLKKNQGIIQFDEQQVTVNALLNKIVEAGYQAEVRR